MLACLERSRKSSAPWPKPPKYSTLLYPFLTDQDSPEKVHISEENGFDSSCTSSTLCQEGNDNVVAQNSWEEVNTDLKLLVDLNV
jgi:hypothetical protein